MAQHSTTFPAISEDTYHRTRRHAGLIDRTSRGRIVVSGADRASYLQGLLTNDIAALGAGAGCYAAYLTAQGRMITDLHVYELGDVMLLAVPGDVKDTVLGKLDQFIFGEDVQLGDVTATFAQLAVVGPESSRIVAEIVREAPARVFDALPLHGNTRVDWNGGTAIVARIDDAGLPGFDVFIDRAQADAFASAAAGLGLPSVEEPTANALRIEAGVPLFHVDMDEETIPLEAGIEQQAISFSKGCYVGQEVIIRVLHRGHGKIARKLVGVTFEGERVPPPGTPLTAGAREIGTITSSTASPILKRAIALGYVHRDFVAPGTAVQAGDASGVVTALPFVPLG